MERFRRRAGLAGTAVAVASNSRPRLSEAVKHN